MGTQILRLIKNEILISKIKTQNSLTHLAFSSHVCL